jgi:hypothetical protein
MKRVGLVLSLIFLLVSQTQAVIKNNPNKNNNQSPKSLKILRILVETDSVMLDKAKEELVKQSIKEGISIEFVNKDTDKFDQRIILTSARGVDPDPLSQDFFPHVVYFSSAVVLTTEGRFHFSITHYGRSPKSAINNLMKALAKKL